jgi:competence protein ComEC
VAGALAVNLVAWVAAFPLVTFHFHRFAPYGAVQSLLLTPFVIAVVLLGYLTIVSAALLDALGSIFGAGLKVATAALLWMVERLSRFPGAVVEVAPPPVWLIGVSYLTLIGVYLLLRRPRPASMDVETPEPAVSAGRRLPVAGGAMLALAVTWTAWLWMPHGRPATPELHVLAVGNGSAAILCAPNGRATLFDLGTLSNWDVGRAAARAFRALGQRRVEAVYVSHANFDHYSGVPTLAEAVGCEALLMNPYFESERPRSAPTRLFFELLGPRTPSLSVVREGDRRSVAVDGGDGGVALIDLLWPPEGLDGSWKPNDRSLVQRLSIGRTRVLITGDVERGAMQALLESHEAGRIDLRCDVLIAPHHGSIAGAITKRFYAAVAPDVVIVSTGRDRARLVELVREAVGSGCRVISTRDAGAATVRFEPSGGYTLLTPYAERARDGISDKDEWE